MEQTFGDLHSALQSAGQRLDEIARSFAQVKFDQEMIDPLVEGAPERPYRCPWCARFSRTRSFLSRLGAWKTTPMPSAQGRGVPQQIKSQN
jgi:hypothetical protein